MTRFWNSRRRDVAVALYASRPKPRPEFVRALAAEIREVGVARLHTRIVRAAALVALMLIPFVAFGGFGLAVAASKEAVKAVKGNSSSNTPAQSQYGKKCGQSPGTKNTPPGPPSSKPAPGTPPGNPDNNTCPSTAGPKK